MGGAVLRIYALPFGIICLISFLCYSVPIDAQSGQLPEIKHMFVMDLSFNIRTNMRFAKNAITIMRGLHLPLSQNYSFLPSIRDYGTRYSTHLAEYSPPNILETFCEYIINHKASMLFIVTEMTSEDQMFSQKYLIDMTTHIGIPVIAYSELVQTNPESMVLQLTPSVMHQCQAMLSLLQRYNWKEFSIIAGSLPGSDRFIDTMRSLVEQSDDERFLSYEILAVIKMYSLKPSDIDYQLDMLITAETRVILFFATNRQAQVILEAAAKKGLTGKEYIWIVSNTVVDSKPSAHYSFPPGLLALYFDIRSSLQQAITQGINAWGEGMNRLFLETESNPSMRNITFSPDYACETDPYTGNRTFKINKKWTDGRLIYEYMIKNASIDTGDRTVQFNEDGTLSDIVLIIKNLDMNRRWKEIGDWSHANGLAINDITWPEDQPTPPKGRPAKYQVKVVTLQENPYVVYSDPDPKTGTCPVQSFLCRIARENETTGVTNATSNSSLYQCCSGFCMDLLKRLSESIGFEFDLFQVEDKLWGSYDNKTQSWNGLINTVMKGEADMVMTSLKITPERSEAIDFSLPYLETGITIIVAVRDGVISPTAFLEPFDIISWIFILMVSINITSMLIFLFEWMSPSGFNLERKPIDKEPYDYPSWCLILVFSVHASGAAIFIFEWLSPSGLDRGNKPIREHRFSLFRSFWLIWSMLFGAAVNVDNPRGVSSRFLGNIWALFAVVFTASYTANLAAFMITKEDYDRLTGIQDWRLTYPESHKPPFKFATIPHGSTDTNIRKNFPTMYRWMQPFNKSNVDDGVKAVKDGEINAFIYDATVLEYRAAHDERCKLRTVGSWYARTGYGIGFPKGSKWIKRINKHLSEYQYNGVMERLQSFWLAGACKKGKEEGEKSVPLGILNFTSAFILLAGGMLLGGLLLLLEHIYFKFFRVKLRKWDKCGCCGLVSLSMGKSLTFEQSVREAIELQKHFKCKNPICETQVWKLKHELDLALLRIDRLQRQPIDSGMAYDKRAVWKDQGRQKQRQPPAIGWRDDITPASQASYTGTAVPDHSSGKQLLSRDNRLYPPVSGSSRKPDITYIHETPPTSLPGPSTSMSNFPSEVQPEVPPPFYNQLLFPVTQEGVSNPEEPLYASVSPPAMRKSPTVDRNKKGSKSLPTSPIKRPVAGPSATLNSTNIGGAQNQPSLRGSNPNGPIRSQDYMIQGDKRSNYEKGTRYDPNDSRSVDKSSKYDYMGNRAIEKETVL